MLGLGELTDGALSVSLFEPNEPVLDQYGPEVREVVAEYRQRAAADVQPPSR